MVDYIAGGYLDDLTPRIDADKDIQQDDVGAFFRDFSEKYNGKTYMITLDGDFHMVYYRTDVLRGAGLKPPTTWDEYLEVAKAVNGKDMNGDGRRTSAPASPRSATPRLLVRDRRGRLADPVEGYEPGHLLQYRRHDAAGGQRGFPQGARFPVRITKYGPPDELNLDVSDTRPLFASGRCALNLDWGDVGTISIDPNQSKVMGKWGAAIMPGSKEVLNWETGKLEACSADTCPFAIDGVNHAPFAAFGGWGGGVNAAADPKVKDAAYAYSPS